MKRLRLGISPCPNATFAFHGLLSKAVATPGLDLAIELADVEELNRRFARGDLDASKCSFHAALRLSADAVVLAAGSALGRGVGPVVLAREPARSIPPGARVLCPGEGTTAHLLLRLFHPEVRRAEHVVFSEILARLERGEADFGVCIHEARFVYAARGLALVEDLGATWEARTGAPLPLGGILARRELGDDVFAALAHAIRRSIAHAREDAPGALATMRRHAPGMPDDVLLRHVELYVNDATVDLGAEGRRALATLERVARGAGLLPADARALEIAGDRPTQAP